MDTRTPLDPAPNNTPAPPASSGATAGLRLRIFMLFACTLVALVGFVWFLIARYGSAAPVTPVASSPSASVEADAQPRRSVDNTASPTPETNNAALPATSPTPGGTPDAAATPTPSAAAPTTNAPAALAQKLIVPVAGVRPEQLQDTFTQARSEGRVHNAIDIMAARGTPVLAAADGTVIKFFNSERGGITLYQIGTDNHTVYYYAHLERYADGLTEGYSARQGETLAYVGDTGNAGPGNYHLHFEISVVPDPKHYFNGTPVNPYPLLTGK